MINMYSLLQYNYRYTIIIIMQVMIIPDNDMPHYTGK